MRIERLGRVAYADAHARMTALLADRIADRAPDTLILCEHDPVYTLGRRRGAADNVLDPGGADVVEVERGGDATFHGPGQLVGYPIVALPPRRHDLHAALRGLEDVLIATLGRLGVAGGRDPRNTGVWVDGRKLGAIGIACRRWVLWHGFALNVDVDLGWFRRMNPCGLDPALAGRLADLLDPCPSMQTVGGVVEEEFVNWWTSFGEEARMGPDEGGRGG